MYTFKIKINAFDLKLKIILCCTKVDGYPPKIYATVILLWFENKYT